jgi:hypothetical protein
MQEKKYVNIIPTLRKTQSYKECHEKGHITVNRKLLQQSGVFNALLIDEDDDDEDDGFPIMMDDCTYDDVVALVKYFEYGHEETFFNDMDLQRITTLIRLAQYLDIPELDTRCKVALLKKMAESFKLDTISFWDLYN